MANRVRSVDAGAYRARRLLNELGEELREARLRSGLRQVEVARALGTSDSRLSLIEAGKLPGLPVTDVARIAGVVGLRLHAKLYPAGPPIRDAAHVALLDRFRARLSPEWQLRLEAPLPGDRDRRAWDLLLWSEEVTIGVEAITRLRDVQAQLRAARLKRRDAGVQRLVLLVAASHANRRALAVATTLIAADLGVGTRAAMAALAAARDPGGDALVVL